MQRLLKLLSLLASGAVLLALPGLALAHPDGATTGFWHGFVHPLGGVDHLLAMLAVGLWASQMGGRAAWAVPVTFVSVMLAGVSLGLGGLPLPYVEAGILASLLVLGVLVASALRLPLSLSAALVGVFALFHGHAHGAEMATTLSAVSFCAGLALASALLHGTGFALASGSRWLGAAAAARLAGAAIALGGLYLATS